VHVPLSSLRSEEDAERNSHTFQQRRGVWYVERDHYMLLRPLAVLFLIIATYLTHNFPNHASVSDGKISPAAAGVAESEPNG
jgi:hypothetical protein